MLKKAAWHWADPDTAPPILLIGYGPVREGDLARGIDDTPAFSAVRTTQARGVGCRLTFRHDAHARAKASAIMSCAVSMSPTLASTVRRQSSRDAS